MNNDCDLLIVGGGPAGLNAAINAASEGLRVCLVDGNNTLGGQARESAAIENYGGFPDGITGAELMSRMAIQASRKFGTTIYAPLTAARIETDGDWRIVTTDDYEQFRAKCVGIAVGMNYRRHEAVQDGLLMGRGIFYSTVPECLDRMTDVTVGIIGGANSAGQAVQRLVKNPRIKVKLLVRKLITDQMSTYLVDRLRTHAALEDSNLEIMEHTQVKLAKGNERLELVCIQRGNQPQEELKMDYMLIFIGGVPQTFWINGSLVLSDKKFIKTGISVKGRFPTKITRRNPLGLETSMPGVFAVGDVRDESTKRISAAAGEGSGLVSQVHTYRKLMEEV